MTPRRRSDRLVVLMLFTLGMGIVLLTTSSAVAATKSISIKNIAYNPSTLTIHVGDKVVWTNNETGLYAPQHTATSDDGHTFDSGYLNPGQSYSVTFTKAGSFTFHCNVHSSMHGTIHVLGTGPSPTSTPTPTPTHSKPKPTATATAKPTVVPVSPTPTSSVKPSPRVSKTKTSSSPTSATPTPSRVVAAGSSSSSSATGVTIGLLAGALLIIGGGLFVIRKRRTLP